MRGAITGLTLLACGVVVLAQNPRGQHNPGPERFTERVVTAGLDNPWEVTWGPDGYLWVTERTAFRVTRVNPDDGSRHPALTLDDGYQAVVQDGLLGLALHPGLLRGGGLDYVYLAYTYDADPGPGLTRRMRIRRYSYDRQREVLESPVEVLSDLPAHDDHGGGRLVIGPDLKLYVSRGDLGSNFLANYCDPNRAQDLPTAAEVRARDWSTYQGKILRLNLDGSIPDDNPALAGVRSHIFAYGLRNPQGLAFGPGGILYASDHGPSTDDELNVIVAGRNYGWPHVAGFRDDRAYVYANWSRSSPTPCRELKFSTLSIPPTVPQASETSWEQRGFVPPIATFFTVLADYDFSKLGNATIAPAGIEVYTSPAVPHWANSVLMTGMRTGAVYRVKLSGDGRAAAGPPTEYFRLANRYRDVALNPDGRRIYLVMDSFGITLDPSDERTETLANPGALLEFTFAPK